MSIIWICFSRDSDRRIRNTECKNRGWKNLVNKPQTFELGTAIKITTILSVDSPTSVLITIKNPANINMVTNGVMISSSANVYIYVYQSGTTDNDGVYKVIIDAAYTSGVNTYTSRVVNEFEMVDTDE